MANRLVGNVVIVDSAMGNSLVLTSANRAVHMDNYRINAIGFYSIDTTSTITLTGADTSNDLVWIGGWRTNGAGTGPFPQMSWYPFSMPQVAGDLKVPVLTAGTAFLYLA